MKALFACFALLLPFSSFAQTTDSLTRHPSKFYVGVGVDFTSYSLYFKNATIPGPIASEYFHPLAINLGYRLNDKASFQIGVAYGSNKEEELFTIHEAPNRYIDRNLSSETKVIAVPFTTRFIFLDTHKRFPVYATFNAMPAWGKTNFKSVENRNNNLATQNFQDSGINLFLTAGVGFNYKIWQRYSGYVEILLAESNLTSGNTKYYGWRVENTEYFKFIWGIGFGFKYDL